MLTSAAELVSGFWAGTVADVADSYARAAALLGENATGLGGPGPVRAWTVRSDQMVRIGPDGRPTYGYPTPTVAPVWVAPALTDGAVWTVGVDFNISAGYVWFTTDPLVSATDKYLVWDTGSPVTAGTLFYGPAAATVKPVTVQPATYYALVKAIAVACDSPATGPTSETVEDIWTAADGSYRVITDLGAYRLGAADTPSVKVGDVLSPGSAVGSAWELTRLGPKSPSITALTLTPNFCLQIPTGNITWYNHSVPTIVDTFNGRTRIRWRLGGSQTDVNAVWTESHTVGTAAGARSLAQAMDLRTNPSGDPGAESLPTSVNPLDFLCKQLFGGNGFLLLIRAGRLGPNAVSTSARQAATRTAAGPYTAVIEWADPMPLLTEVDPT